MKITIEKNDGHQLTINDVDKVFIPQRYSHPLLIIQHETRYIDFFRICQIKAWYVDTEGETELNAQDDFFNIGG